MITWRITKAEVTDSTNNDAINAALSGESEGFVIWSLRQTSGRGRQGRTWESPEGNLYCSVLLCPQSAVSNIAQYSFVAALAVRDTVQTLLPEARVFLKWPNDILVDNRKISGILLEAVEQGLVVGIGLNILHHPDQASYPATSMVEQGLHTVSTASVLELLLERLLYWVEIFRLSGFVPIRAAWLDNAIRGKMTVHLPHAILQGTFADLDINGCLRLHLADGSERSISSGDVFMTPRD